MGILKTMFDIFVTWPWLVFLIIFIAIKVMKRGKYAFGLAADVTTFFLLFSIPQLTKQFFDLNIGVLTWIIAVVFLMMMTTIQWRTQQQLKFFGVLKLTWRILFLLYAIIYVVLWAIHLFMP